MKAPAFQCYPKDLLVDTTLLSAEQFGVYWRLCCYAWKGVQDTPQCALPENDEQLARMAGVSTESFLAMRPSVVSPYFEPKDGLLWHPRLLEELKKQTDRRDALSEAGRRGAELQRVQRSRGQATGHPNGQATGPGGGDAMALQSAVPSPSPSPKSATAKTGTTTSPKPPSNSGDVEKSLRTAIREHLHLGALKVVISGTEFGIAYSMSIARKMLARGMDPDELLLAIENVRRVDDVPADAPLTLAYLDSQPAILNQAISAGHKRRPLSAAGVS